jgi:hypothetical protein
MMEITIACKILVEESEVKIPLMDVDGRIILKLITDQLMSLHRQFLLLMEYCLPTTYYFLLKDGCRDVN